MQIISMHTTVARDCCSSSKHTSQTESPRNAKATGFQLALTPLPCKSGLCGSTGVLVEPPAPHYLHNTESILDKRLHTKRVHTGKGDGWTETCRLGVTTMPPCSRTTTCRNDAWNTVHPVCCQKRFERKLEHVPAEKTCSAELFSKKFDSTQALTRWSGLDKSVDKTTSD